MANRSAQISAGSARAATTMVRHPETRIGEQIAPQPNGCWLFTGKTDNYGRAKVFGQIRLIHRYVYEVLVGEIPEGYVLHHTCETKPCCNPAHLQQMTPSEHGKHHAATR